MELQFETLTIDIHEAHAYVTLNRPHARNAMNYRMVEELYTLFTGWKNNRAIRAVVLQGADGMFCAGGDLKEMRENAVPASESGGNLDNMLKAVNQASQVVIAKIEGAALGGGLGLLCVSDIALASRTAQMGMPEVRLGIAPSFISPYVLKRIGLTRSRELMLTGRRFSGDEAKAYGLVHEVCETQELDGRVEATLNQIRQCAPGAIAAIKQLLFDVVDVPTDETVTYRADLLDRLRTGDEGQEGMMSFIEKRSAKWVLQGEADAQ
jgi:isohexenylglutaconyl-CoA hydratase